MTPPTPRAGPPLTTGRLPRSSQAPAAGSQDEHDAEAAVGDCAVYAAGRRRKGRLPLGRAADAARSADGFVWIGLQQPTPEQVSAVAHQFDLPQPAVEDAIRAHQRPKLEVHDGVLLVVLKPVRYVDSIEVVDIAEVAMFVGPTFVVSVRHGDSDVLGRVRRELDADPNDLADLGPIGVLWRAVDHVVDQYEDAVERIAADVDELESVVFGDVDADHTQRIYTLKRKIAEFRRAAVPLQVPVERLAGAGLDGVTDDDAARFREVQDHLLRACEAVEGFDHLLSDILQAHLARIGVRQTAVSVRQNADMRRISAWAAIALVPTAIAGIYGMNFDHMPELRWRYGYFAVLLLIVLVCAGLHRAFRRNGWL